MSGGSYSLVIIEGVPSYLRPLVWDTVWPLLKRAAMAFPHVVKPDLEKRLIKEIDAKQTQLWVVFHLEDQRIIAAATTQLTTRTQWPESRFIEVPLIAGERLKEWRERLWTVLCAYGLSHDCTDMLGFGRRGWKRVYGFEDAGTLAGIPIMRRRLRD